MLNFSATNEEVDIIRKIVERWQTHESVERDTTSLWMDIEATHSNGCPLDLQKLLDFPDFDFFHDVFGIERHLNRTNGKLENCFLPRCAR